MLGQRRKQRLPVQGGVSPQAVNALAAGTDRREVRLVVTDEIIKTGCTIDLGLILENSDLEIHASIANESSVTLECEQAKPSCTCATFVASGPLRPHAEAEWTLRIRRSSADRNPNVVVLMPTSGDQALLITWAARSSGVRRFVGWLDDAPAQIGEVLCVKVLALADSPQAPVALTCHVHWSDGTRSLGRVESIEPIRIGNANEDWIWSCVMQLDVPRGGIRRGTCVVGSEGWKSALVCVSESTLFEK